MNKADVFDLMEWNLEALKALEEQDQFEVRNGSMDRQIFELLRQCVHILNVLDRATPQQIEANKDLILKVLQATYEQLEYLHKRMVE